MDKTDNLVDINAFDIVSRSAEGHEFELKDADGVTGTGVHLTVIGRYSDDVAKWNNAIMTKMSREAQMAARRGKAPDPKSLEDLRAQNIEGAAIRVIGWRGVKQPFDRELLKAALRRNPHWIDQIVEESDQIANFSKAP
jgi:hypothetical protein